MNDEFLNALRRDPPPHFARRLKQRLQAQEEQSRRRRTWSLRALLFLVVGSAFASGMLVMERRSAAHYEAAQLQPQAQATTAEPAPGRRVRYADPGFVLENDPDTVTNHFGNPPSSAAASANGRLRSQSGRSGQTTQSTSGVASAPSEQIMSGGLIRSRPAPSMAISPIAEGLIRARLSSRGYQKFEEPRIQVTAADAAFTGFCAPSDTRQFDLVVSSRRIGYTEFMNCHENGISKIIESKLGYQVLVLTSARDSAPVKLSPGDVYLAISRIIPDPADPTRLISNVNFTWDQVNSKLAYRPIAVFGPARDTPLRAVLNMLLLDPGCNVQRVLEAPQLASPDERAEICHSIRTDRLYSEVEQNAALISQTLWSDPHGFVVVDYPFYRDNRAQLGGSALEGPEPSYATFVDDTYQLAQPVYLYGDATRMDRMAEIIYDDLQELQEGDSGTSLRFGFIAIDDSEADQLVFRRRKAPLTVSDLNPPRNTSR